MDGERREPSAIESEVAKILATDRTKKAQDFLREFSIVAFEKALAFNALIMSAGYVGEFALWDRVREDLSHTERMLIASLLTISITVYMGWTVKAQWMISKQQLYFSRMIRGVDAADWEQVKTIHENFVRDGAKTTAFAQRYLPLIMGMAVGFAALAAIVMVIELLDHLAAGR